MSAPISGPPDLTAKTAVVTGAAGGIGTAICATLAREGADVIATDIDETGLSSTVNVVESYDQACTPIGCDITDPSEISALKDTAAESHESIDIVVNAAGLVNSPQSMADLTLEEWYQVIDVNLTGTFLVSRAFYDVLEAGGKVICIASVAGKVGGVASGADYVSAKAGVIGFTKWLAKAGAEDGIYANCIAPGPTNTSLIEGLPGIDEIPDRAPLGRLGEPEDIAEAVLFLSSQQSNWITGEVLDVNGGLLMD